MCRVLAGFSMRSSNTSVLVAGNRKNSGFYAVNCHFFLPNWGGGGKRGGRRGGREGGGFCQMCLENQPSTSAIHGRPLHLACSTGN